MKNRLLQLFVSLVLGLATSPHSFAAAAFRDDFNDGDDSGWTRYEPLAAAGAPGIFSFPNGTYRIQASPSPDPASLGPGRAGTFRADQVYSDFIIAFDLVGWDNSLNQSFGTMARASASGPGSLSGYLFTYSPLGTINLSLIAGDQRTLLASKPLSLDPSRQYYFDFEGHGRALTGGVFSTDDKNNPIGFVQALDSTFTTGENGFYLFSNTGSGAADATFDNYFAAQNVPEPSFFGLTALGGIAVFWATRFGGRRRPRS